MQRRTIKAGACGGALMSFYRCMNCKNVTINGDNVTPITAYVAKPEGTRSLPRVLFIHHLPDWSDLYIETTRRYANHGYLAICANPDVRTGGGDPHEVAAKMSDEGGIPD